MTAYRVIGPSGSNGAVQFASDGEFGASTALVFDVGTSRLLMSSPTVMGNSPSDIHQFTGSAIFSTGMSGSHTSLSDGRSYLVAGSNVTITSASDGQITISAASSDAGCGIYWRSETSGSIATTGSVAIGGSISDDSCLWVNGMNLTPIANSVIVPGSTHTDTVLLNLSGALSGNQYGSFNIDVVGTTKGITSISNIATAKWMLSVSMLSSAGQFQVVGITELDGQNFKGPTSVDTPSLWDVNFNSSGSLYVNTAGTPTDTAWGAIVTKQTIIDVDTGELFSGVTLISGSLTGSGCECCHDPYWISNNASVVFTTGSVFIGDFGTSTELRVNGINLTPISGSAVVPGGTSANFDIMSLSGTMSDNQLASFNIDVVGSTKGITAISEVSAAKRIISVSVLRAGGQLQVVGITEIDSQSYDGPSSADSAVLWDVNVNASGTLYVNTAATPTDTAWGAIIMKQSVMDVNTGGLLG